VLSLLQVIQTLRKSPLKLWLHEGQHILLCTGTMRFNSYSPMPETGLVYVVGVTLFCAIL